MYRPTLALAVGAALVLSACDSGGSPSAPPTEEDALTTSTQGVAQTTGPGMTDDTDSTSAGPTTEEPTDEGTDEGTGEEVTDDVEAGPPVMPEEAREHTEAGAEAFVEWYLSSLNWAYMTGDSGNIEDFATEDCSSCINLLSGVTQEGSGEDYLRVDELRGVLLGDTARVEADVTQLSGSGAGSGGITFALVAHQGDMAWVVDAITLREAP